METLLLKSDTTGECFAAQTLPGGGYLLSPPLDPEQRADIGSAILTGEDVTIDGEIVGELPAGLVLPAPPPPGIEHVSEGAEV